jgi:hypothetical protein
LWRYHVSEDRGVWRDKTRFSDSERESAAKSERTDACHKISS